MKFIAIIEFRLRNNNQYIDMVMVQIQQTPAQDYEFGFIIRRNSKEILRNQM